MTSIKNRLYALCRTQTVGGHLQWHFIAFYEETTCRMTRGGNSRELEPCLINVGRLNRVSGISAMSLIFRDFSAIN